jgi:hypothetical protein
MKILVAYPHSPYGGGASNYFRSLASELSHLDNVALLLPEPEKLDSNLQKYNWSLPFRVLGSSNSYWPDAKGYSELTKKELDIYIEAMYKGMKSAVLEFKPDIIHTHLLLPSAYVSLMIKKEFGIPVVVTSHGHDVSINENFPNYHELFKNIGTKIDSIIGVSPDHCQWIGQVFSDVNFGKVVCIHGGVEINKFQVTKKETLNILKNFGLKYKSYFMTAGRLEERKGFDVFIKSIKITGETGVIVGSGWDLDRLRQIKKDVGADKIKFIDFLGPSDAKKLGALYNGAISVAIPSLTRGETLCFVGLEAMGCGAPIVVSNVGGLPYIADGGNTGCLVAPGKIYELAETLLILKNDYDLRSRLGKNGRRRVIDYFQWKNVAEMYRKLFMHIIYDCERSISN